MKPALEKTEQSAGPPSGINAVVFDWGGVLIDNPTPAILAHCREFLGVGDGCLMGAFRRFHPAFQEGRISEKEFWERVCRRLGVNRPLPPSLWRDAFSAAYAEKPGVFALATRLRQKGCRTAVLSNTEQPASVFLEREVYAGFDAHVLSFQAGCSKPGRAIYDALCRRLDLPASEILFIDDALPNVDAAKAAGLSALLFTDEAQLARDLSGLLE